MAIAPLDVILSDEVVVQQDLFFVKSAHLGRLTDRMRGAPDLVIEVLSEYHVDRDRFVKKDLYARFGIPEYRIIDDQARAIEVYVLKGREYDLMGIFTGRERVRSPTRPGLRLRVDDIF